MTYPDLVVCHHAAGQPAENGGEADPWNRRASHAQRNDVRVFGDPPYTNDRHPKHQICLSEATCESVRKMQGHLDSCPGRLMPPNSVSLLPLQRRWLCELRDGDIDVAGGLHVYCRILMRLPLLVFEMESPVCESAN